MQTVSASAVAIAGLGLFGCNSQPSLPGKSIPVELARELTTTGRIIRVEILKNGALEMNGRPISMSELEGVMQAEKDRGEESPMVVSYGSGQDGYDHMIELLELSRKMDRKKVGIVSGKGAAQ